MTIGEPTTCWKLLQKKTFRFLHVRFHQSLFQFENFKTVTARFFSTWDFLMDFDPESGALDENMGIKKYCTDLCLSGNCSWKILTALSWMSNQKRFGGL